MPINGATPIVGATAYVAPTGGSADSLSAFGSLTETKAVFDGDTDVLTQKSVDFSVKEAKVSASAPNGYTQVRRTALIKVPRILDNGARTVSTVKIELADDVEANSAEIGENMLLASQICSDPDFASFWALGIPN
jgi:hypothetical protein